MVTLRYTGEQIIITPAGVSFLKGKDDKYIYIPSAFKLFTLIADHSHWHGKHLQYEFPDRMPGNDEMLIAATRNDPEVLRRIEEGVKEYDRHIEGQIREVGQYTHMDAKEKEALVNNLRYMKPYRLQRQMNKLIYRHMVNRLVDEIHTKEIERIEVPPTRNFFHVLESIRGGLIGRKVSNRVSIEATTRSGRPVLRLNPFGTPEQI